MYVYMLTYLSSPWIWVEKPEWGSCLIRKSLNLISITHSCRESPIAPCKMTKVCVLLVIMIPSESTILPETHIHTVSPVNNFVISPSHPDFLHCSVAAREDEIEPWFSDLRAIGMAWRTPGNRPLGPTPRVSDAGGVGRA